MASFLDVCIFVPTAGGTTDWTYSTAVGGYQSPAAAGVVNGAIYRYRAQSADLTQWEIGYGAYNTGTGVLARSTVMFNSLGTTAKINFSTVPQVAIVALSQDLGGWTNRRLPKSSAYTVAQADNNASIALGGAAYYALTFGNPSGYDLSHNNVVINEDTARGKLLLPFYTSSATSLTISIGANAFTVASGLVFGINQRFRASSLANNANFMAGLVGYSGTTLTMTVDTIGGSGTFTDWQIAPEVLLWPGQSMPIFTQNSIWYWTKSLWNPQGGAQLNVSASGNDSSDGLGTTTGAVKTVPRAVAIFYQEIFCSQSTRIIDGASGTFQGLIDIEQVLPGGGPFQLQNMTLKPANSGYAVQVGDWVGCIFVNVTFDTTGVTTPVGYIHLHQHAVVDLNTGITVNTGGLSTSAFDGDGHCKFNINNGITIVNSGGAIGGVLYDARTQYCQFNVNGTHTFTATPVIGRFCLAAVTGSITFQGNVTFSGANSSGNSLVGTCGVILNLSGATLPGGAPTPTLNGIYSTTIV